MCPLQQRSDGGHMANPIHAFNTRRLYTAHGQRIAWAVLSTGNVAMLDIDRGIDYVLKVYAYSNREVLASYDHILRAPFREDEQREARELETALADAARAAPSLAN
jgi:hypothetical protein